MDLLADLFELVITFNGERQRIGEAPLQCSDGRVRPSRSEYQ
jgi:hypothetical protein